MCKLLGLVFSLWASFAYANVPCTLPFNLQNNTIADATQVMANYNALVTCLTNAAAAGSNNDITALLGLSTPLGPTFGGTSAFIGGTSSGSANVQSVTVTPSSFSLTQGYKVSFTVGTGANTGPTTLNVNATGAISLLRKTQFGTAFFVGGEWNNTQRQTVEYDGANWQWVGVPPVIVGSVFDYGVSTGCPLGALSANSQAVSRTTWAALFNMVGTTWGAGDGSTTFNVPDFRNRATYGQDQNVGGLSNRITVAGGNFDGTVFGNSGGLQNHTMTLGELVSHNHTDSGHTHSGAFLSGGSNHGSAAAPADAGFGQLTGSGSANIQNTGSTNPFTVLAPAAIVNKCIQG